ncbi:hypothetical protein QT231_13855 [Halomonas sp. SpR1]|uniref:hypothetical protein n=1 Tax=Halomonas sp. SpR1 TaxID=3050462 RepID=UPI0027E528DE|nr:hypothetical protein [Halomonas sp. SpR1]MDQ7733793.1 hypothetical protein [Halomonas sp. SpR1]
MYHSLPINTYISILKRIARKQQQLSSADKQTACLARIAKFSGFQSWPSLIEKLHHPYPGQLVWADDLDNLSRGLKQAAPQAFEHYIRLVAWEILRHRFIQKTSIEDLAAADLEPVDVYVEVLSDFEGMLSKELLTRLIPDLERDGVWGMERGDIMIDEFSMSDW